MFTDIFKLNCKILNFRIDYGNSINSTVFITINAILLLVSLRERQYLNTDTHMDECYLMRIEGDYKTIL